LSSLDFRGVCREPMNRTHKANLLVCVVHTLFAFNQRLTHCANPVSSGRHSACAQRPS
jgi:hypothetical protein